MPVGRMQGKRHRMETKRQRQVDVPSAIQRHKRQPASSRNASKLDNEQWTKDETRFYPFKNTLHSQQ